MEIPEVTWTPWTVLPNGDRESHGEVVARVRLKRVPVQFIGYQTLAKVSVDAYKLCIDDSVRLRALSAAQDKAEEQIKYMMTETVKRRELYIRNPRLGKMICYRVRSLRWISLTQFRKDVLEPARERLKKSSMKIDVITTPIGQADSVKAPKNFFDECDEMDKILTETNTPIPTATGEENDTEGTECPSK